MTISPQLCISKSCLDLIDLKALSITPGRIELNSTRTRERFHEGHNPHSQISLQPLVFHSEAKGAIQDALVLKYPQRDQVDKVVQIGQWSVQYIDFGDLRFMWQLNSQNNTTIFIQRTLHLLVLDCGSNIGVSVIRYKQLYPQAKTIAFEPDPTIFNVLENNIRLNTCEWKLCRQLSGQAPAHRHSWRSITQNSQAGHISLDQATNEPLSSSNSIEVKTVWLGEYLRIFGGFLIYTADLIEGLHKRKFDCKSAIQR